MAYVNLPDGRKVAYIAKKMRQQVNRVAEAVAHETREKFEQPPPPKVSDPLLTVKIISLAIFVVIVLIITFQRK